MGFNEFLKFDPTFGWKEMVAIGAAIIAICALFVSILSYRIAKKSATSEIEVQRNHVGYDSRGVHGNVGRFLYYWTVDITNHGGRAATFQGFRCGALRRWAFGLRNGKLVDLPMSAAIYVFEKPQFYSLAENPGLLSGMLPRSPEELGALNIAIPAGETTSLSFALVIDNQGTEVDGYSLSLKMKFNRGKDYDLSTAIGFAQKSAVA